MRQKKQILKYVSLQSIYDSKFAPRSDNSSSNDEIDIFEISASSTPINSPQKKKVRSLANKLRDTRERNCTVFVRQQMNVIKILFNVILVHNILKASVLVMI